MVLFARRVARVTQVERTVEGDVARYAVRGPLFFGSSNDLIDRFASADDPADAVVDLTHAQVRFEGLDERSTAFHARLTGRLGD